MYTHTSQTPYLERLRRVRAVAGRWPRACVAPVSRAVVRPPVQHAQLPLRLARARSAEAVLQLTTDICRSVSSQSAWVCMRPMAPCCAARLASRSSCSASACRCSSSVRTQSVGPRAGHAEAHMYAQQLAVHWPPAAAAAAVLAPARARTNNMSTDRSGRESRAGTVRSRASVVVRCAKGAAVCCAACSCRRRGLIAQRASEITCASCSAWWRLRVSAGDKLYQCHCLCVRCRCAPFSLACSLTARMCSTSRRQ